MTTVVTEETSKLADRVAVAFFSGSGNTFHVVKCLADELAKLGREVTLYPIGSPEPFSPPEGAAVGLALPVACFSTYPTVWRFIDSLPEGRGRGIFMLATMGGLAAGMDGPIRKVAAKKGYRPLGSKILTMPGNYANKAIPDEKNAKLADAALRGARNFAKALTEGKASWDGGVPLISAFFARLAHTSKPWRAFYHMFPLEVDGAKCLGCGLCRGLCPEGNITLEDGRALIGDHCQSCQRCIAFCPANAVAVPGKPAERYRGPSADEMLPLLK